MISKTTKILIMFKILTFWLKNPELRFCQMIYILTYRLSQSKISKDIFYVTDKELLNELNERV